MQNPVELYQKILTEEFIRELHFLLDVASGRAPVKADFTDKLLSIVKTNSANALSEMSGGAWLGKALEYTNEIQNTV